MRIIEPSELLIREDGSIYHLHLLPEQLADTVILVGDPGRVETVAGYFESIECKVSNREFYTITGKYNGHRDRKSTRLNSSHEFVSRMPSSA